LVFDGLEIRDSEIKLFATIQLDGAMRVGLVPSLHSSEQHWSGLTAQG
jgi:hypothetical protein